MDKTLLCVGLDVGTTTTQMVVSHLKLHNKASAFAVPEMEISETEIVYRSPVYETPLAGPSLVDGSALEQLVAREYRQAGITPADVDTGAVIVTGETSRKENAGTVVQSLSEFAGDFVVATAGPDLESVLAAKGAGAVAYSEKTGKRILHIDIGGGTSNLALIEDGQVVATGCMNVGGRLLKLDDRGCITWVSPALYGVSDFSVGDRPSGEQLQSLCQTLVQALEMAAGLREKDRLMDLLWTKECQNQWEIPQGCVLSFSGGVADCIGEQKSSFGDIGHLLGQAIKESRLCRGEYRLGQQTIRATVIGAGSHSVQLSGSTVFCRGVALPVKSLPVIKLKESRQEDAAFIRTQMEQTESSRVVLAMPGFSAPSYDRVKNLARTLLQVGGKEILVCLEADMAKALGQCIQLMAPDVPCLCLDSVAVAENSYLDVGAPVGPCFPVVVKTLILKG